MRSLRCNDDHDRPPGARLLVKRERRTRAPSAGSKPMFARSTLPTLAALVLLACGSAAGAEAFDAHTLRSAWTTAPSQLQPSSYALRGPGRDSIEPGLTAAGSLRSMLAAPWPDGSGNGVRPANRLSFDRASDDTRAGSSASITLGRLILNETRGPAR